MDGRRKPFTFLVLARVRHGFARRIVPKLVKKMGLDSARRPITGVRHDGKHRTRTGAPVTTREALTVDAFITISRRYGDRRPAPPVPEAVRRDVSTQVPKRLRRAGQTAEERSRASVAGGDPRRRRDFGKSVSVASERGPEVKRESDALCQPCRRTGRVEGLRSVQTRSPPEKRGNGREGRASEMRRYKRSEGRPAARQTSSHSGARSFSRSDASVTGSAQTESLQTYAVAFPPTRR